MDTDSEYYNIYSKEPTAKVAIYASILYFVIIIYESMADIHVKNMRKNIASIKRRLRLKQIQIINSK